MNEQWYEFAGGNWQQEVDVRDFILKNYRLYDGDDTFLVGPTEATTKLWDQVMDLTKKNVKTVAYWIWIPKSFQPSLHMTQDT